LLDDRLSGTIGSVLRPPRDALELQPINENSPGRGEMNSRALAWHLKVLNTDYNISSTMH